MKAWITRDANGRLFVYHEQRKPNKDYHGWVGSSCGRWHGTFIMEVTDADLHEGVNPQWSDDEPIEVELKIERVKQ